MADNKIIEALRHCQYLNCVECGRIDNARNASECLRKTIGDTLNLINRQKAEIERLQHILVSFMSEVETWEHKHNIDTSNIPKIAVLGTEKESIIERIKSEAYKEFAERLEARFIADSLREVVKETLTELKGE